VKTIGALIGAGITGRGKKRKASRGRAPKKRKKAKGRKKSPLCKGAVMYSDSWYEGRCG
jgi:hypothetical protein